MPVERFARDLPCWKDGGRKTCAKDETFKIYDEPSILQLEKSLMIEKTLYLQINYLKKVNIEIVNLKLILKIKKHSQEKKLEVILQESIFIWLKPII